MQKAKPATEDLGNAVAIVGSKVQGIGFLIKNLHDSSKPPGAEIHFGIGEVLMGLGRELDEIQEEWHSRRL